MTTHCGLLAGRIPRTEDPGGMQPMGSQRVRQTEHAHTCTQTHTDRDRFTDTENRLLVARGNRSDGRMDGSLESADANNYIQDG